ncbi:hypothetical protein TrST_g11743 [Triparma strigata]|uniref:Uncharacterized protein n=1 Tax=Triparma strigata TaxID=1606541 RepID=A0A9W7CAZ8_9STRA|nr:hypothetical protein TrST_g11743 [Triparma strigata]
MGKKKSGGKSKSKKTSSDATNNNDASNSNNAGSTSVTSSSAPSSANDLKSFYNKMPPNQLESLTKIKMSDVSNLLVTLSPHYTSLYKKSLKQFSDFSATHGMDEVPCCLASGSKKKKGGVGVGVGAGGVIKWLGPLTQKECKDKNSTIVYTYNVRSEVFSAVNYEHYLPALVSHSLTAPFPLYQDSWLAIKFTNLLTHPHPTSSFELVLSGEMKLKEVRELMREEFSIKNIDEVRFKIKKKKEIVDPNSDQKLIKVEGIENGVVVIKDMGKEHKGGWFLNEEFSAKDKKDKLPSLLFKNCSSSTSSSPLLSTNSSTHGFNILGLAYSHLVCRSIKKQYEAESEARKNENDLIAMMMDEEAPAEKAGKSKSQKKKEKEKQKKLEAEKKKKEEEEEKERQYKELVEKQKSKAQDAKRMKEEEEERVRLEAEERWKKREEEERMLEEERMNEMLAVSDKATMNMEKERLENLRKEEELRAMEEQARLLEEQMNMKLAVDSDSDEEDDLLAMLKAEEEEDDDGDDLLAMLKAEEAAAGGGLLNPASLGGSGLAGGDLPEPPKMTPLPLKPGELLEEEVMNSGVMGLLDDDDE